MLRLLLHSPTKDGSARCVALRPCGGGDCADPGDGAVQRKLGMRQRPLPRRELLQRRRPGRQVHLLLRGRRVRGRESHRRERARAKGSQVLRQRENDAGAARVRRRLERRRQQQHGDARRGGCFVRREHSSGQCQREGCDACFRRRTGKTPDRFTNRSTRRVQRPRHSRAPRQQQHDRHRRRRKCRHHPRG